MQCGTTITASTTLDSELIDCPPPYAIRIDGVGVTLDLGGHTVDGAGEGWGVATSADGDARATVVNGHVKEFRWGIVLGGSDGQVARDVTVTDNLVGVVMSDGTRAVVEGVTATRNSGTGINLSDQIAPVVKGNEVFGNASGMGGGLVRNGSIRRNSVHDNDFGGLGWSSFWDGRIANKHIARNGSYGIFITEVSDNNFLKFNHLIDNGTDGIFIDEFTGSNTLEGNRAFGNGDDGIDVNDPGSSLTRNMAHVNTDLGIEAVDGTIDGGGNKARRNGNPAQCTGVKFE